MTGLVRWRAWAGVVLLGLTFGQSAVADPTSYLENGKTYYRPATLQTSQLRGWEQLSDERKALIRHALTIPKQHGWLKYRFGGATPQAGGFDCSGAMYFVLRGLGFKIPRSSAQQYLWLKDAGNIHPIPAGVSRLDHSSFSLLTPGDLLFWSGTYRPTDGRKVNISHVSIYLGQEKDGRHVMIGATKGRSYRGKRGDGYGVYDFKLPAKTSRAKFIGYGPPVGLKK
ncbi:C40 family peptidase [Verrucomicrobiaceae bacterium 5K15]|uniref:C40 family peptidase n=1 Tax=Oceaniferula flava TaxID=2800421 RepID=A0AAE2SE11_9BACT|nr:NlpC/P60 family protein [Oceaniferula flavus]MBK1855257.1 C40 family peptidase [Oceaniferula flavus]MBM1136563.1 C40 family peptidase [Oceaniferula flavus]